VPQTYDVAVAGYGPVGAVAAALLGGMGLSVHVCDASRTIYDKPRAFALDHEIMRVFQQLGLADRVMDFAEPFTPSEFYGVDGQLIKRFHTLAPPYPLAFVPSLVFNQPRLEQLLREHVAKLPAVTVELGVKLESFTQDDDGVTLQLRDGDATRQVHARYLVGCDGASSTVRSLAGLALDDLGFDQPWLVVDVLANERGVAKLPTVSMQICEPQRPTTYLVGVNNHRRWEIAINPDDSDADVTTDEGVWKLLARWITPNDAQLWRHARYRFHALVAHEWRKGRVFIAGDAAHQQPPFLGQGMCQGVRDAANLSWKLAAVLRGDAGGSLLDTYGMERGAHVADLTTRIKAIGQLVGERDLARARGRDARLLAEAGGQVQSQPRQSVQPALRGGLLSPNLHEGVGTLFPQPWLIQGDGERHRMDDAAGRGWRLIGTSPVDTSLPEGMVHIAIGRDGAEEADGVVAQWFARHACRFAIVRPDHYVWGVAADEASLATQLRDLQAQLNPETSHAT
jgi:3-(3-hydroxy-phenyl)propionate hydroxylase